jgi:hypothetical protein
MDLQEQYGVKMETGLSFLRTGTNAEKKYTIHFGNQKRCCHMGRIISKCIFENNRSGNGDWTEFLQDRVPW